jgi:hypothetical protein
MKRPQTDVVFAKLFCQNCGSIGLACASLGKDGKGFCRRLY